MRETTRGKHTELGSSFYADRICDQDLYHVKLSDELMSVAEELGHARITRATKMNLTDKWGEPSPESHLIGAVNETAQRFLFGVEPRNVPKLDRGGPNIQAPRPGLPDIQCRGTDKSPGVMWVRGHDDEPGLIVVGSRWWRPKRRKRPKVDVTVWGWMLAAEAMTHSEWLQNPGNRGAAYAVPWCCLHDLTPMLEDYREGVL
jgi:hypothetical protein